MTWRTCFLYNVNPLTIAQEQFSYINQWGVLLSAGVDCHVLSSPPPPPTIPSRHPTHEPVPPASQEFVPRRRCSPNTPPAAGEWARPTPHLAAACSGAFLCQQHQHHPHHHRHHISSSLGRAGSRRIQSDCMDVPLRPSCHVDVNDAVYKQCGRQEICKDNA